MSDAIAATDTPPDLSWQGAIFDPATPGKLTEGWLDKVPQEERGEWERSKSAATIFDVLSNERTRRREAQTELRNRAAKDGGIPLRPEGEQATPEALKEWRQKMGLPVEVTEYGMVKPKDYPDKLWDQQEADDFAKMAHDLDLPVKTVQKMSAWYQERGLVALGQHNEMEAAKQAAAAKERADRIQGNKETLAQEYGVRLDSHLKNLAKMVSISGMEPMRLDPDSDQFVGVDAVKAITSMYRMLPKSGDSTSAALGRNDAQTVRDRTYWTSVLKDRNSDDYKALTDAKHPRHQAVVQARNLAYEVDVQQAAGRR